VNRMMGAARGDTAYKGSTLEVFTRLANKAGYQVIVPKVSVLLCQELNSALAVALDPDHIESTTDPLSCSQQRLVATNSWYLCMTGSVCLHDALDTAVLHTVAPLSHRLWRQAPDMCVPAHLGGRCAVLTTHGLQP